MTAFVKINGFVENLAEKKFDLGADVIKVALSNTAPGSESTPPTGATSTAILANVTQISYTNLSARTVTISASSQSAGTYSAVATDLVLTSSGGSTGPFRYVYVYDDTATNDELIGYYDYGSSITLADGETFTIDFGATLLTLV